MLDPGIIIGAIGILAALMGPLRALGASRRDFFDKAINPYFKAFEDVHMFYSELFVWARDEFYQCAISDMDGKSTIDAARVRLILEEFQSRRRRDERLRDDLRDEAQEIFRTIQWQPERRFLMSVMNYFLGEGGIAPSEGELDRCIDLIVEMGGRSAIDTPSVRLYLELGELVRAASPDIERIVDRLDQARSDLNQAYVNVRRCYRLARDAALLTTV